MFVVVGVSLAPSPAPRRSAGGRIVVAVVDPSLCTLSGQQDLLSSVGSVRLRSVLITDRGDSRPGQRWRLTFASHWLSALTLPTIPTNGEPRRGDRRPKWRKWRRINTLDIIWRGKWWVGEDGVHHFLNKTLHSTVPHSAHH